MDKLIHDNGRTTISNDGATIMKLLDIVHPAAKTLVDISLSQDAEVGDGTTSVVLLAGELLKNAKSFIEEGMHSQIIVRGFRQSSLKAVAKLKEIAVSVDAKDEQGRRELLEKCAGTALNSKLICRNKDFFAPMCVQAASMRAQAASICAQAASMCAQAASMYAKVASTCAVVTSLLQKQRIQERRGRVKAEAVAKMAQFGEGRRQNGL